MPFRIAVLIASVVAGVALGTASDRVAEASAGAPPPVPQVKYYDPLP